MALLVKPSITTKESSFNILTMRPPWSQTAKTPNPSRVGLPPTKRLRKEAVRTQLTMLHTTVITALALTTQEASMAQFKTVQEANLTWANSRPVTSIGPS
jgi:hypothetical protein